MTRETLALAAGLLRITLPAVMFLSLSGLLTGLLYALNRFTLPAFTSAVFNASVVVAALLFGQRFGVASMALGILAGAVVQIALQAPGLRGLRLRPALDLSHPALRRIAKLYVPVAGEPGHQPGGNLPELQPGLAHWRGQYRLDELCDHAHPVSARPGRHSHLDGDPSDAFAPKPARPTG